MMNTIEEIIQYAKHERKHICNLYRRFSNDASFQTSSITNKYKINALYLLSVSNAIELSLLLNTNILYIERIINAGLYKEHYTYKKNGKKRHIQVPEPQLKKLQKSLNYFLQAYYLWVGPDFAHGFKINKVTKTKSCNIVENAKPHVGKKYLLNIDLKDFFPSISAKRIKDMFTSPIFSFDENLAIALTLLTTYKGKLPTGAPTSPAISNFICMQLDNDLNNFATTHNLNYTRYADDLSFSSDTPISYESKHVIFNLIKKNNFLINYKKVHFKTSNRRQTVTGLTVNEKVNVDRKLLKKTRAMLHDLITNGLQSAVQRHFNNENIKQKDIMKFVFRLEGYINFIGQVKGKTDPYYLKQKATFDKVFE